MICRFRQLLCHLNVNTESQNCICPVNELIRCLAGLTNKRLGRLEDSLDAFYKLHAILRNSPQVMYQVADLYPLLHS